MSRARFVERLRDRRSETEETIFARVRAVGDGAGASDAEYLAGLRATVSALVEYVLAAVSDGEEASAPVPSVAIAQVQLAARIGVPLETVWLRYGFGLRHLEGFVMDEAEHLSSRALRDVLDALWSLNERLIATMSAEYHAELARLSLSHEQRRAQRVRKLIVDGDHVEIDDVDYDLCDAHHTAFIVVGPRAREAVRALASRCDMKLLAFPHGENTMWAWLGGQSKLVISDIDLCSVSALAAGGMLLAIGESGWGIDGWRLSHHQAQAALLVALHTGQKITRYAGAMLLAAALQNETLARSLEALYLAPLTVQKDGGAAWCDTLDAYFKAEGNVATAATAIGVDRHTVLRRLRSIESALGQHINTCRAELEVALRLHELRIRDAEK
jgi:hypothetical protein